MVVCCVGVDQVDVVVLDVVVVLVDVCGGWLEYVECVEGVEIGLCVLLGGRQVCVLGLDFGVIDDMVVCVVVMVCEVLVDDYFGLVESGQLM